MELHGIDFTSAPTKRKGITIASGEPAGDAYALQLLLSLHEYVALEGWIVGA